MSAHTRATDGPSLQTLPAQTGGGQNLSTPAGPPIPHTFGAYLRSFGPGIIVVLTWLGAGDIVDMGVAGSTYGYSLLWVLVVAVAIRFLFVSLIARYQLCNQHGEGVLDGLVRLHRGYAPLLFVAAVLMSHVYLAYMSAGTGEACRNLTGVGETWQWALLCNAAALLLVFRPSQARLEVVFKGFLVLLSVSFIGSVVWVGFDAGEMLEGLVRWELPGRKGQFNPLLVAVAMVGAVGGSLMNLVYPYFLEAKGWRGPAYRRLQLYDFVLAMLVLLVLNLAVWVLGAELLYPEQHVTTLDDLPRLVSGVLGPSGRVLFYLGIFAAIFTSILGHAAGLGELGSHAWLRWRAGTGAPLPDRRTHRVYRGIVAWSLVSSLVWTLPGMPDFVTLTLLANSAQVVLTPLLAGGLWWITASSSHMGAELRNRWWENLLMALLLGLVVVSASTAVQSIAEHLT